jgi:hypothetical protein
MVLIPWSLRNAAGVHTVLVLVQLHVTDGEEDTVTIDVVDSAPWTLRPRQRDQGLNSVWRILAEHDWHTTTQLPETMGWILGPRQFNSWQSSYFAVFNAWTIMLGCTLNYGYKASPNSQDHFECGHRLLWLVLNGQADWRVIYSFLRCIEYIEAETEVPEVSQWFQARLPSQRNNENMNTRPEIDFEQVRTYNELQQAPDDKKRGHRSEAFKKTDSCDEHDIFTEIPHLLRKMTIILPFPSK